MAGVFEDSCEGRHGDRENQKEGGGYGDYRTNDTTKGTE